MQRHLSPVGSVSCPVAGRCRSAGGRDEECQIPKAQEVLDKFAQFRLLVIGKSAASSSGSVLRVETTPALAWCGRRGDRARTKQARIPLTSNTQDSFGRPPNDKLAGEFVAGDGMRKL